MARILVVDDSGYARRLMRKTLEQDGHEVTEADGGLSAIESYFVARPDLVLLDLTMEDMSGLDVLKKLREIDRNARVIVVSADVQSSTAQLAHAAGAYKFLGKPADSETLLSTISEAIGKHP